MIHDVALEVEQEFDRSNLSEIAKHVHCDRKTVRKYLNSRNLPVVIKKRKRTSKQNPFKPYIISRLAEYPQLFGKRILRDIQERGYDGCYSIVTDYLREIRDEKKTAAIYRYETKPGHQAQVNRGDLGLVHLDGEDRHLCIFTIILGYSRMRFAKYTLSMNLETLIQSHIEAFEYFCGISDEILYDNMKTVIIKKSFDFKDSHLNKGFVDFASKSLFYSTPHNNILMPPIQRHTNYGINKIVPPKQNEIVISSVDERIDTILQSYRDTGPKNTLIIIGNGFDLWQGLKTDYNSFKEYYLSHRKEIERSLGMKIDKDISDVEQIYGNPLSPDELPDIFWNSFESSLGNIDAERIFLSFDKSRNGIREIRNVIKNGSRILHRAIIDWVSTIEIEPCETEYNFRNNCIFINFNYTDTLVKRFHVNSENIFHIHGSAQNPKLIRMGHSKHPQTPEPGLDSFGIRFRELHLVEQLLYDTDKQVKDNIQYLSLFLIMKNISLDDITDIYVLGHSFGNVDIDYFRYLYVKTKTIATDSINDMAKRDIEGEEKINQLTSSEDEQQWKRINYIIHRYGYSENAIMRGDRPSEEEMREYYEAIVRKHTEEQNVRDKIITDIFIRKYLDDIRNNEKPHVPKSENALPSRQKSARWHVSCYTDDDKKQVRNFFDSVGCTSYDVFDSIDECIETFRK